jgi:hypothetical protein
VPPTDIKLCTFKIAPTEIIAFDGCMDKTPTDVPSNVIVAPDKTLNSITPVFSKSMNGILVTGIGTINMFLAMDVFFLFLYKYN